MARTKYLYVWEMIVGCFMLLQATVAVVVFDNIKWLKWINLFRQIVYIAMIFYPISAGLRSLLYFNMHQSLVKVDKNREDKGIGSYLAEYVDDHDGSLVVAWSLVSLFGIFYLTHF